ncbi:hypothetical protein RvY_03478-2 [Ramazzottius varieornatus]|uniref:Cadherin domain-containing protein n=1 Tax=Ramazzottius varieornatus TaxID=947166 RepID=A0A1D1UN65_RAMVA|nr:hypothetical protein RvY_03478-2 [Ramazzottius varieornatus]
MSSSSFTIDQSGNVRTTIPFLTAGTPSTFVILATDNGGLTGSATVTVNVVGTCTGGSGFGRAPIFQQPAFLFTVPCSTNSGNLIGTVPAFDPDGNAISYSISSSGFSVDSSGNIRSVSALSTASQTKTFVVAATDTTGLSTTATVTVSVGSVCQINGNAPGFNNGVINISQGPTCQQNLYTATVLEGTAVGTFVQRVNATSPTGSSIVWSIPDNPLGRFTINPQTGDISTAQTLGRRPRAALEFRVRGTDSQTGLYCESTIRINILPNTTIGTNNPTFPTAVWFINSGCPSTIGQFIGYVVASSPTGSTLTYSISPSTQLQINAQTGLITNAAPITANQLILATVTATDANGLATTTSVQVNAVCNTQNSLALPTTSFTVSSCSLVPSGTQVGTLAPTGGTAPYTYTVISGNFAVSSAGIVTTTTSAVQGIQTLVVQVNDQTGGSATGIVSLTITCTTPTASGVIANPNLNIPASSCVNNQAVGGTVVSPPLVGLASFGSPPYTFAISGTDPRFSLSPAGVITTQIPLAAGTYFTTVVVTANNGVTVGTATVTINACGPFPTLTPTTICAANTPAAGTTAGATLATLTATGGSGSGFTFSTPSTQLAVSSSGVVTAVGTLPAGTYTLPVTVTDSSGTANTQFVTVTVTSAATCPAVVLLALPLPPNTPIVIPPSDPTDPTGTVLPGQVAIASLTPTGGTPGYTFAPTVPDGRFLIDPTTGAISVSTILGPGTYSYQVTVTDANGQTASQTFPFIIQ